ncbi:hypothetical protein ON010_g15006 [Phytophthora cinnamomi]|nr:hypothetical protein ON010_g15006 [Phytophthora cinnamomi]
MLFEMPLISDATKGEGFVVSVKPEGFGFIQPVQTVPGTLEENLFFHIKEVTTGQTLAELKEGTEVQYTVFVDEKKKKKRAIGISVVPAGTVKKTVPESIKGVVTKPSFLQRMKSAPKGRFTKTNNKTSTLGRIRLVIDADDDDAGSDADGDGDSDDEEAEEENAEAKNDDTETESKNATASDDTKKMDKKREAAQKTPGKQIYLYNIRDIADPTVVLREGDEVEFIPQVTPKNLRAANIRLILSHAKQGVVVRVTEDLGGVIRIDGNDNEQAIEASYTARSVLRGDVLSEGDRVEFAYRAPSASTPVNKVSSKSVTDDKASEEEEKEKAESGKELDQDGAGPATVEPFLGRATSVLRLSSSPNSDAIANRRGLRSVNSTLKEAMRQVGANAMVASRMAKGPDGTRGFAVGWSLSSDEAKAKTEKSVSSISTTTTTTTVTTTMTTSTEKDQERDPAKALASAVSIQQQQTLFDPTSIQFF